MKDEWLRDVDEVSLKKEQHFSSVFHPSSLIPHPLKDA